jgi:hypothetical protein
MKLTPTEEISDLIYADTSDVRAVIVEHYPHATFKGDEDEIHGRRLGVTISTTRFDWYKFLLTSGLSHLSLNFQLSAQTGSQLIKDVLDVCQPGWRG